MLLKTALAGMEGKGATVVHEVFHELPNQVIRSKNASATNWLRMAVFLLGDEGVHPTVKAK